jgi:hypothetical protein
MFGDRHLDVPFCTVSILIPLLGYLGTVQGNLKCFVTCLERNPANHVDKSKTWETLVEIAIVYELRRRVANWGAAFHRTLLACIAVLELRFMGQEDEIEENDWTSVLIWKASFLLYASTGVKRILRWHMLFLFWNIGIFYSLLHIPYLHI